MMMTMTTWNLLDYRLMTPLTGLEQLLTVVMQTQMAALLGMHFGMLPVVMSSAATLLAWWRRRLMRTVGYRCYSLVASWSAQIWWIVDE